MIRLAASAGTLSCSRASAFFIQRQARPGVGFPCRNTAREAFYSAFRIIQEKQGRARSWHSILFGSAGCPA